MISQLAFVFPGQGSQSVGMLAELADAHPSIRDTFAEASEGAGVDLWQISQDNPDERLNQSVEGVEYELATAVRKVAFQGNKVIGYITGQGELPQQHATDLLGSLQEYYRVALGELDQIPTLQGLDLIIVAKPTSA